MKGQTMLKHVMMWTGLSLACGVAVAAPRGEDVVGGSATFDRAGDVTTITTSDTAIINYDSFNIAGHETVKFVQPGARSRVLNRIRGNDPTRIDGTLLGNGIVYIVNPAGVFFGNGSLVNVGGLYAGAGNVSNADFLSNINHFTDVSGNVVNRGTIDASLVAMVGRHVANYGTINVPGGMVTMVAGDDVLIAERDRSFAVRIEGLGKQAAGSDAETGVKNEGTINAEGGSVVWGAGDVYAMGIHNTGSVKAKSFEAEAETTAHLGGSIDVSNTSGGGAGGEVTATAEQLVVSGTIDASGATGGGEIKLGGDWQGGGEIEHAQNTLITSSAHLIASAINNGAGGTIVIWSDGTTVFLGAAEAAGTAGQPGGNVETSGKYLHVLGGQVTAPNGQWLLDPFDVEAGDFAASAGGAFDAGDPNTWTPAASPSQVDVDDIMASLNAGTSVTITTAGGGAEPGDITVTAAITKTAGGDATLTFDADNDIDITAPISSAVGLLGVTLDSDGGDVTVDSTIDTNGGDFSVVNAATYTGNAAVATAGGAVDITTTGNQNYDDGAIDAGAGDVTLTTTAGGTINEITENQTPKITTTGTFTADATAGGSIGDGAAAGVDPNEDPTGLFDVDAPVLDLEVVGTGNINVMSHAAGGTLVTQAHAADGFPRIYTVGAMTLADNAVLANDAPGAGFTWLISESTIDAQNPGNLVLTTGPAANARFDANGDIGTSADPLVVDATGLFVLVDRGPFDLGGGGAGSAFITNQRAGQTNIVTMQLDAGDAVIEAPGDVVIADFSADFDTSFLGAGNFTVTSTGGNIGGTSPITMNGGTVTLNSAGDIGTPGDPLAITGFGSLALDANGGAGSLFLDGNTFTEIADNVLADIDPAAFAGFTLNAANVAIDIQPNAATDIDVNEFDLPAATFDDGFVPTVSSLTGDVNLLTDSVDLPMTGTDQTLTFIAQSGDINLDPSAIDAGAGTVRLEARSGGAIIQTGAGPHVTHDADAGRVELVSDTSIGSAGNPIELAGTDEVVLDVNDDLVVQHDGATDISVLSIAADPAGLPTWTLSNFAGETIDDAPGNFLPVSFDFNPTFTSPDTDHMLINNVRATTSTSYSFTSKTGHVIVDDDNAVSAATPATLGGADAAGDGGIFSGDGDVTLIAGRGSIVQELAREDTNVRTNSVASTGSTVGPVVTLRALGEAGDAANAGDFEGSIGGNGDAANGGNADNAVNVENAMRLVLQAGDHFAVRGTNQPVESLDITVDSDAPIVGSAFYTLTNFMGLTYDVSSDGTNLFINAIENDGEFDGNTQGARVQLRTETGDITVGTADGLGGIKTRLTNTGADGLPSEPFFGLDDVSVDLEAAGGSILLHDNAIQVNGSGGAVGQGTGTVRLSAAEVIDEATDSTTVNVTSAGLLQMFANNAGGADEAIGDTVTNADLDEAVDVSVQSLVAQAGQSLEGSDVHAASNAGGVFINETDDQSDGLALVDIDTADGDIDIRSAGDVTIQSDDPATTDATDSGRIENVTAGNADRAAAGNGDVTIVAGGTIGETTPAGGANTDANVHAEADQVALVAGGAIGATGAGAIDIESANLVGQVDSGAAGGLFVRDATGDLAINSFAVPGVTPALVPGVAAGDPLPGLTTFDGAFEIDADGLNAAGADPADGVLTVEGLIATDPSAPADNTVTLTARQIVFDNVGVPAAGAGGILDTDDIDLLADDGVILNQSAPFNFRTAAGTDGRVSFGQFSLPPAPATPVNAAAGTSADLLIETDGNGAIFFAGSVGEEVRLASLTTMSDTGFTFVNADVFTAGGTQTYLNPVILTGDSHMSDTGGTRTAGVHFHDTVDGNTGAEGLSITVQRSPGAITSEPEVPLISFADDAGGVTPLKWLRLNAFDADDSGAFDDDAGDIFGRTALPTTATIVVAARNPDGSFDTGSTVNWIANTVDDFTMGRNEKLVVNGSADVNANLGSTFAAGETAVRLSDFAARTTLAVDANGAQALLLNDGRLVVPANAISDPPTGILTPGDLNGNGALDEFVPDRGLDFWGLTAINITNATLALEDPADPAPRWFANNVANITGATVGQTISHPLGFPTLFRNSSLGVTWLDPIPLDTDFNFASIFAAASPEITDWIRIPLTTDAFVSELLIDTREARAFELQRRVEGETAFQDMVGVLTQGGSYETVLQRIREGAVPMVLESFRRTFFEASLNEAGEMVYTPRYQQVRESLAAGVRAYVEGTGKPVNDPILFRTFLEQTGEADQALATLNALRDFYADLGQLGLTPREWSQTLYLIASKVAPTGLKPDVLNLAALAQPE